MDHLVKEIIHHFSQRIEVEAITIGGSRARQTTDIHSDYDIYVYTNQPLNVDTRKSILADKTTYTEYQNMFWEEEDDGILKTGVEIELIYRDFITFSNSVLSTYHCKTTSIGYSTCMLENVTSSIIMYDKDNQYLMLKQSIENYPFELKSHILKNNLPLIADQMPSLLFQIEKAWRRMDVISINHRISEFLAIYFDILFAFNQTYHPGEKRMLFHAKKLHYLPDDFERNIMQLFSTPNFYQNHDVVKILSTLSTSLYALVDWQPSSYKQLKK